MDNSLIIKSVNKFRGKTQVLEDIDLTVAPGERLALLGHNGAGKSTLIKSILGLTPIHGGSISINGAKPGSAAARLDTAFLPEAVSFHPALTGREQLNLFANLSGAPADVPALLERVGLADALDRRIGTYSKGMRQRLGLAQVLLGRPKVALLDEPTSNIDLEGIKAMKEAVAQYEGKPPVLDQANIDRVLGLYYTRELGDSGGYGKSGSRPSMAEVLDSPQAGKAASGPVSTF